jgi:hypothetical protein
MSIVGSNFLLASRVALLPREAQAPITVNIPTKPSHVVIAPADVYEQLTGHGAKLERLAPGTLVSLMKSEKGWVLVAKDGKQIGYVAENQIGSHAMTLR